MAVKISPEARAAAEQLAEAYMMIASVGQRTKIASLMKSINWSHGVSERAKMAIIKRSLFDVKNPKEAAMAASQIVDTLINGGELDETPTVEKKEKVTKSLDRVRLPKASERIKKESKKVVEHEEAPLRVKRCQECKGWIRLRKASGEEIPRKSWGKFVDLDNVKVCDCEE
jgi:hypothetical protein